MTAPVTLFTGKPGAGKTAQLVAELVKLRKAEPGRPLFQFGINGLKDELAGTLTQDQLYKWWELPPGSIIAIDECQEDGSNPDQPVSLMPKDRGMPADWVQRITKVRHQGMSFLLTTQDPANMSAYVRRLVGRHVHTVNKFQSGVITRYEWGRCMDDPESRANRKQAIETMGTLPKEVFDMYKSSQLHTMKPRLPKKLFLFAGLVVAAVGLLIAVPFVIMRAKNQAVHAAGGSAAQASPVAAGGLPAGSAVSVSDALRRSDYAAWMRPRVEGIPWTAPAFDQLQVTAVPRLACMAVEDGRCNCVTEQGTRYEVPLPTCRAIVRDGLYNPFAGQPSDQQPERRDSSTRPDQPPTAAPGGSASPPTVAGVPGPHGGNRATASAYLPPEVMARPADEPLRLQH